MGINQSRGYIVVELALVRCIRRAVRFSAQVLVAYENTIRHANVPEISVMLDHWQPRIVGSLLKSLESR